jgi:hypothetical protein
MIEWLKKKFFKSELSVEKTKVYYVSEDATPHYFHYHIKEIGKNKSLCSKSVFDKDLPINLWGYVGHNKETYCDYCKRIYDNLI